MASETIQLLQPFKIHIDPMERLLLVNFEKDPDKLYVGFEPQVFDDESHGKGHLIIGWRIDGKVDVYHQPTLTLDPGAYSIAGKGLENMVATSFENAFYETDQYGVQAHYSFKDIHERAILIKISEKNTKKRKPFGLLAPMGDAAENPTALPLVLLHEFYFVRKRRTLFEIYVNEKKHLPDPLPFPMDLTKMYFTRYSPKPLIVTLNPAFSGKLSPMQVERNQEIISNEEYEIEILWKNDEVFIRRIIRKNKVYPVSLVFDDPFPNLQSLQKDSRFTGKFTLEAHASTGRVRGEYLLHQEKNNTEICMIPVGGWIPQPTKFSLWFLYTVAKIFRKWPTTYKWTAGITRDQQNAFSMVSKWERIKSTSKPR